MSNYTSELVWSRGDQVFTDNRYSRQHVLRFDGGAQVNGSSSPQVVPIPMSDETAIDPEEMLIASLSSCHMLWFLSIAAKQRFCVDQYHDIASGRMEKNTEGRLAMTVVILQPKVSFSGSKTPSEAEFQKMHHLAHEECFIANSVKCDVRCEAVISNNP